MEQKAIVLEKLLDKYIVKVEDNIITANLKGTLKRKTNVLVGDIVLLEPSYDKYLIKEVQDRKNSLIRPPVANIDVLVIVLSICNPEPDFILLDKQLALCHKKNIQPIICVNKMDLNDTEATNNIKKYIDKVYKNLDVEVVSVSAKEEIGFEELFEKLKGKICAFSGNSGVGKSSIIKYILKKLGLPNENIEVNEIGKKSNKGRHTTKYVKLYILNKNTYILDTPGFSSYELFDIEYKELPKLYADFLEFKCEFDDCMHIKELEKYCKVKEAVIQGKLDKARYERYMYIFDKLKETDDKKYK